MFFFLVCYIEGPLIFMKVDVENEKLRERDCDKVKKNGKTRMKGESKSV